MEYKKLPFSAPSCASPLSHRQLHTKLGALGLAIAALALLSYTHPPPPSRGYLFAIPGRHFMRAASALLDGPLGALPPAGAANSFPDTTGPGIPHRVKSLLSSTPYGPVDEVADAFFPAGAAVGRLEAAVGWSAEDGFSNAVPLEGIGFSRARARFKPPRAYDLDIVIPSIRDLDFLEAWRPYLEPYHLILVQDGNPDKMLKIPSWADFELHNRRDIEAALGADRAWVISSRDASIRNFGFLVSRAEYVYTLDDDCLPLDGSDPVAAHLRNLVTNSTPYFFNTLYDPFADDNDFVRGYPYSLRAGVPTAVSHGLWLNAPDYDAPTQLLKLDERNKRAVDAVLTVPAGVFYPMCSMNVAFNRELIGPAFMQGLMGDGQPWARYDDMFAGWASKKCADALGVGVKTGMPYIRHNKASNPFTNLKKEYKGLFWQEDVISFFKRLSLSQRASFSPQACYLELADAIEAELLHLHAYFGRLARAMRTWVELWDEAARGAITFRPSRVGSVPRRPPPSPGPLVVAGGSVPMTFEAFLADKSPARLITPASLAASAIRRWALLTIVFNEPVFLPIWYRHYARHFLDQDMFVIDNDSTDGSADTLHARVPGVNLIRAHSTGVFDHAWLVATIQQAITQLIALGYEHVLFCEVDELVLADPDHYPGGLTEYREARGLPGESMRVRAYQLVHQPERELAAIDLDTGILTQRGWWYHIEDGNKYGWPTYDKTLLCHRAFNWVEGFHTIRDMEKAGRPHLDPDLVMVHLKRMDFAYAMHRISKLANETFAFGAEIGLGTHHHLKGDALRKFLDMGKEELVEMPGRFRSADYC